jgi:hypothetical protein
MEHVRYVRLGVFCILGAFFIIMAWICVKDPIVVYQDRYGQAVLEHPYASLLPYLAAFTLLLAFSSFYFAYSKRRKEIGVLKIDEENA